MEIIRHKYHATNVGKVERAASIAAGTLLVAQGLRDKGWTGTAVGLLGIAFLRRGVTGHSYSYRALGIDSASGRRGAEVDAGKGGNGTVPYQSGIRVDDAVTINRPRSEVFRFWRDLGNIADFMEHVESIRTNGDSNRAHWIAKVRGGKCLEWETQIINEKENELIAWRSIEGSEVANAGSVHFKDAGGARGTEVHLEIMYSPAGGPFGAKVAKLFGEDPATQIRSDLKRLKARLETGVLPDTAGQPAGAKKPHDPASSQGHAHSRHDADQVSKASEESFPASDSPAFTH